MAENPYVSISAGDLGADVRAKLNSIGSDVTISLRRISAIANVASEIAYFSDGTIIYSDNESKFYYYNGSAWAEYVELNDHLKTTGGTMTGDLAFTDASINNVDYVLLNTSFTDGTAEGRLQWNTTDGTLEFGLPGGNVNLQIGQEMLIRVKNDQGSEIGNGEVVYISSGTGSNPLVKLANAGNIATAFAAGVATETIATGQFGYATLTGLVRDVDTDGYAPGTILWLSDANDGQYTNIKPTAPSFGVGIAVVVRESATVGVIQAKIVVIPRLESLSDIHIASVANDNVLVWDSTDSRWENKEASSSVPIVLSTYDAEPARGSASAIHGGIEMLASGQVLNAVPSNISVEQGIGKLIVVVNAGADISGDITVTGDTVDRETGVVTIGDSVTISVDALTTDVSDTDGNGNARYSFTGAYITSKWFTGTVVFSTLDLSLTDVDVYHCSFEQFNDTPGLVLTTFDVNLLAINIAAQFDAYLYLLEVTTGNKIDLSRQSSLNLGTDGETPIADRYYRLRKGNIDKAFDGSTDGIFVNIFYPNPAYIEDMNMKVWATKDSSPTFS